jgi:ABC-type branched-subunit amino acid transport system ATPase component
MNNIILYIQNLKKAFNGITPIKDLSLSVKRQSIILISGENGAGKTTLFNLISGIEIPDSGEIYFDGINILNLKILKIARLNITRLYQNPRVFKNLKVWENLVVSANNRISNNGISNYFLFLSQKNIYTSILKEEAINLLNEIGLSNIVNETVGSLSYGQQKIVSFCMAIMNKPKLILLDEPFTGINKRYIDNIKNIINIKKENNMTFLIIEHNINEAYNICDLHVIMNKGSIVEMNSINGNKYYNE